MNPLKRLAGETALYGLGSILPRVLNFLLVPLHTVHMFSRAEYGQITKVLSVVAFVNVVYMLGMETSFFRFATRPGADPRKVFQLSQTIVITISVVCTILLIAQATPLAIALGMPGREDILQWVAMIMMIDAMVAIPFAQLRLQHKAKLFAGAKLVNVLLLIGLNYYFLKLNYDPGVGIGYVFLANLLANAVFILLFIPTLLSWRPMWDRTLSPAMLQYGYPVMLTGLAGMTNEMFSRLTLDWWLPPNFYAGISNEAALGIFGACYKFAVFMNLGIQAFRYAAEPFFFTSSVERNAPEMFAKVNHFFVLAGCVVLMGVSLNLDLLQNFIGEEFREGMHIVPILLTAYLFLGIYYNLSAWFKITDKTYWGTVFTVGGAVVTILANFLLIPHFGYEGSSWAALACYASMTIACYVVGQRYWPVPYRILRGGAYLLSSIVIVYAAGLVHTDHRILSFVWHQAILLVFVFGIWQLEKSYWSENH